MCNFWQRCWQPPSSLHSHGLNTATAFWMQVRDVQSLVKKWLDDLSIPLLNTAKKGGLAISELLVRLGLHVVGCCQCCQCCMYALLSVD